MPLNDLCNYLPDFISREYRAYEDTVTEIRIRANKPVQIVCVDSVHFIGASLSPQELRRIAVKMMDHSYYAHEKELSCGFFTMKGGCRVGIGGSFGQTSDQTRHLQSIGSLCIRIARNVPDCAVPLIQEMTRRNRLRSTLVISRPGMGKTTMLRDASRLLSEMGYTVGIADERCEIAACRDGIPSMDVGLSADVVDGCPKAQAIEHLIRSMAPQVIVTDEIGNREDAEVIRDAARKGVILLASTHADSFDQLESGSMASLVTENIFSLAALLEGKPGNISGFREYGRRSGACC